MCHDIDIGSNISIEMWSMIENRLNINVGDDRPKNMTSSNYCSITGRYKESNSKSVLWNFTSDVLPDIMSPSFGDTGARHDV